MNENRIIEAKEGYVFKRISDGMIVSSPYSLGYTYYIGGMLLEEPVYELPEHFEEVPDPDPEPDM